MPAIALGRYRLQVARLGTCGTEWALTIEQGYHLWQLDQGAEGERLDTRRLSALDPEAGLGHKRQMRTAATGVLLPLARVLPSQKMLVNRHLVLVGP